jgi:hypothetical protein
MSKIHKQSKKAKKTSKRAEVAAKPEDDIDTESVSTIAEAPQVAPTIPEAEVAVEPQKADAVTTEAVGSGTALKVTRSETAKANIKEGLKQHAIAGRPTKAQLILVFGTKGYAMTWPKRSEKFGITPETFQAALTKGVPAVPLPPVAKPSVEKTTETA